MAERRRFVGGYNTPAYSWVPACPSACYHLANTAVIGGHEPDQTPIWVGRASHEGDVLPCKVIPKKHAAYVAYGGEEILKFNIEILCTDRTRVRWVESSSGFFVHGSIIGGRTAGGEQLYIGRGYYMGSITPGKIHPSHQCLYISFGGKEIALRTYEALAIV